MKHEDESKNLGSVVCLFVCHPLGFASQLDRFPISLQLAVKMQATRFLRVQATRALREGDARTHALVAEANPHLMKVRKNTHNRPSHAHHSDLNPPPTDLFP
jgi:hypothetical protein